MCAKWLLDAPAFSSNFAVHGWLSINSVPKFQNSNGVDGKSRAKEGVALSFSMHMWAVANLRHAAANTILLSSRAEPSWNFGILEPD